MIRVLFVGSSVAWASWLVYQAAGMMRHAAAVLGSVS